MQNENNLDGFIVYRNYIDTIELLPEDRRFPFFKMLYEYAVYGIEPCELALEEKVAFAGLSGSIRACNRRRQANIKNGQKGGAPKGNTNATKVNKKTTQTTENNRKQPKSTENKAEMKCNEMKSNESFYSIGFNKPYGDKKSERADLSLESSIVSSQGEAREVAKEELQSYFDEQRKKHSEIYSAGGKCFGYGSAVFGKDEIEAAFRAGSDIVDWLKENRKDGGQDG